MGGRGSGAGHRRRLRHRGPRPAHPARGNGGAGRPGAGPGPGGAPGLTPSAFRWPVLLGLSLASRLVGLMALPMFLDERIHLRWAYWIEQGRRLRVPLLAGRGLRVYLLAGIAPHADDPLRAGRLLTVAIGLVTLVACHRLAVRLTGDRRVADVTALFYIACPFTLLYDRMVLTDAFLAAFTALTLLLSVAVAEEPRPRSGVALGVAIAFGVLSKTTGLVLFVFPLLAWALLGRDRPRSLLFTTVSLLPLSAWGLLALADLAARHLRSGPAVQAVLAAAGLVLVLLPALRFDRALWTDPTQAPLPALDRFQYVTGWPSGYGSRDSMAFLRTERERRPDGLLLVTPGPSTTASAIRLLWAKDQAVEVRAVDPGEDAPGAGARRAVYVIVSLAEGVRLPPDWARDLRLELTSFKPDGTPADALYRACAAEACP